MNATTGEVIVSHDADARLPIASITKLMTVIVALEHHQLTDVVDVDPRAAAVGQESVALAAHESITVLDLVKASLIQSANDAADALALATAPSFPAFAALMNAKAAQLGLHDSNFVRPDGLDASGAYSSAADVTVLARAAMHVPVIRTTVAETSDTISAGRVVHTWNDLLGAFPGVIGVKTGHTHGAGWSQVAAVQGNGITLYAAILGSPSRYQRNADLETLLAYGLARYRLVNVVAADTTYADVSLPYGMTPLQLVAASPLQTVVHIGVKLSERVVAPTYLVPPIDKGSVVGTIDVYDGTRLIGRRPLVASRTVHAPSVRTRIAWYARRTVHNMLGLIT